jgi:hypothetical protein
MNSEQRQAISQLFPSLDPNQRTFVLQAIRHRQIEHLANRYYQNQERNININRALISTTPIDADKELLENLSKQGHTNCAICLEDYKEGDPMRAINICFHYFHGTCITEWINKVRSGPAYCPLCKAEI